ncbi:insecticidal delta-endotoxin Cry8Ea1 family protein [Serratia fonticola]|uniref:insecticidal delta-endotoxin Cry8Ea1 family protein n=1 Tax=Serratia fonticola TaxID=47917 RepID=UPI000426ABF1|nr:insecticidal delta-endotoxin Cry8Ea1 family protein [Serratia fonticola]
MNTNTQLEVNKEFDPKLFYPQETFILRGDPIYYDVSGMLKSVLLQSLSLIPAAGGALSFLVGLFWPNKKSNLWEQALSQVQHMIEVSALKVITGILSGDIAYMQTRMQSVAYMMENFPNSPETKDSFNNLADDLDGFHNKFKSFDDTTNYNILPMYSITVTLQLVYWINGLEKYDQLGLSKIEVAKLERFINNTFGESKIYIDDMYDENLNNAYNNSYPNDVVNNVMSVQGHCRLHGIEYISIWTKIKDNRSLSKEFYIDTISYSTFFGRQTPKVISLALTDESEMYPPFKPNLINGRRNKIKKVTGFIIRIGGAPRVGGIKIVFEDDSSYDLGSITSETNTFELKDSVIKSVEAWGDGAIDQLTFNLSDNRVFSFGQMYSTNYMRFAVSEQHHIAGLFLANDGKGLAGQAANFGVSYQIDEDFDISEVLNTNLKSTEPVHSLY